MALPQFTLRELMEAGVHYGHNTSRWNPKMAKFIFGKRNGIHILDLQQTVPMLYGALATVQNTVAAGGKVLFVGTKRQAQDLVAEAAGRSGQYFVNHRWLGGMLTNWKTINKSIRRLKELEDSFAKPEELEHMTKKERLGLEREFEKLHRALGGIKEMQSLPDILIVMDAKRDRIAIDEANCLGIPVIAIVDSNVNPEGITHPIPGNDDATRSLKLYTRLISDAVLAGIAAQVNNTEVRASGTAGANVASRKTVVKMSPKATAAAEKAETEESKPAETETAAPAKKDKASEKTEAKKSANA